MARATAWARALLLAACVTARVAWEPQTTLRGVPAIAAPAEVAVDAAPRSGDDDGLSGDDWAAAFLDSRFVRLLQAADDDLVETQSKRVLGVGYGVFFLTFFFICTCMFCCIGGLHTRPAYANIVGFTVFFIVVLVLFCADVTPRYKPRESQQLKVYNAQYVGVITVFTFMLLGTTLGTIAFLCYDVCQPIQAVSIEDPSPSERRRTYFGASKIQNR